MKRILVTGAGGYIGIPLCERLLKGGYHVLALDRFFFGMDKVEKLCSVPGFEVMREDIRYLDPALLRDVDAIVDLAGLSNDATAEIDPRLTIDINYSGAVRLAQAAKEYGVKRYVYSSSASVYGNGTKLGLAETDELCPITEYARSKVQVESSILPLADHDFQVVILRNATVYGLAPRMRFDLVINVMTMRAWKNRVIYIMGGGAQWRPLVHVQDVVEAFLLALEAPTEKINAEIFNVGSDDQNYQIQQLAHFVVDVIPNVTVHRIPDDPDKRSYNVSFSKIHDTLKFSPLRRVHEGIVEIKQALERGVIDPNDPTCFTLQWYKSIIEWSARLQKLTYKGTVLTMSDTYSDVSFTSEVKHDPAFSKPAYRP
jgi:nucleoside-diphosphate-sugar epimerase